MECNYPDNYKCLGCTESGTTREKDEGKKYSSSAWGHSYEQGKNELMQSPGGRYAIHSSGGKKMNSKFCKNTIIDYSLSPLFKYKPDLFDDSSQQSEKFKLDKLEYLFLCNNKIVSIPDSTGKHVGLVKLKLFDLSNNQIAELPESIGKLVSLQKLKD